MSAIQTTTLPSSLTLPGEQLRNTFPSNLDSLCTMLGLCLAYLRSMHPIKHSPPSKSMQASAHLLTLFQNDPITQSLVPKSIPSTVPVKELNALKNCNWPGGMVRHRTPVSSRTSYDIIVEQFKDLVCSMKWRKPQYICHSGVALV